jgi:hypothetical protein
VASSSAAATGIILLLLLLHFVGCKASSAAAARWPVAVAQRLDAGALHRLHMQRRVDLLNTMCSILTCAPLTC